MRTVETIDKEIKELKDQLISVRGTDTEVYTRIVGYYRSVRNWNKGKRDEYNHRKVFSQPDKVSLRDAADTAISTATFKDTPVLFGSSVSGNTEGPAEYLYFYRTTCPNCIPVKKWLNEIPVKGTAINVDEKEGFEAAGRYRIYSSPTVIFLDSEGDEMYRAGSVAALEELYSAVSV